MKAKTAVYIGHGRTKAQIAQMKQIARDGLDPFDWDVLPKYHKPPILRRGRFWLVTENEFPYEGTTAHLLLVYRTRVRFPSETPPAAWNELQKHLVWIEKKYHLKSASLLMRFGDPSGTGGSVDHLHVHVIAGGTGTRKGKKIKVGVGYQHIKENRRAKKARRG